MFSKPLGAQTCLANTRQGHGKKKSSGELGKKNQTNAGRVSRYTSLLHRNDFFYFLRLFTARQAVDFSQVSPVAEYLCMSEILSSPRIHHRHFHPYAQSV